RGKKAPFARIVGVAPRTVDRWLRAEVDVSEASVREVARALGIPAVDLLVAAGYFDARDLADVQGDPALQMIYESDLPEHVKDRLVERLREMRQRELDDLQWWIEQARGARCMAWIRILASGLWAATVSLPDGRRVTETRELKGAIERWATELESDIRRGDWIDPRAGRITVGECWQRWGQTRRLERASRKRDESHWRNHVAPR